MGQMRQYINVIKYRDDLSMQPSHVIYNINHAIYALAYELYLDNLVELKSGSPRTVLEDLPEHALEELRGAVWHFIQRCKEERNAE